MENCTVKGVSVFMTKTSQSIHHTSPLKKPELTAAQMNVLLFFILFALEMVGAIYMGFYTDYIIGDAFSRTANAYYVLFIKPPRLASIGFVWNPLPSMLQLPFIALSILWKPIVTKGFSGAFFSATFAAASCVILHNAFNKLNIPKNQAFILNILYVTNPFIFYYGFIGMSEMLFFFLSIYAVICMTLWLEEGSPSYITKTAIALALAFLTRYEAIPFAFAVGVGFLIIIFWGKNEKKFIPVGLKEKYYYAEGALTVLYMPFLYSIFLWIFFNWMISGNPFYFLNSSYSNLAQSQYASVAGNPLDLLGYVATMSLPFIPVLIGIIVIRLSSKRLLKSDFFILLAMVITMIAFHYFMLIKGASYGWLRFFSYSLPICIAWVPYELSQHNKRNSKNHFAFIVLAISLLISSFLTIHALMIPRLSPGEHDLISWHTSLEVSEYINTTLADEKILTDSYTTSEIILTVDNIDNIVTSASLHFYNAVDDPRKYGITYILIPDVTGVGALDAIVQKYPNMYKHGTDWCTEEKAFDGYKIFKVIY
jgi:hypothetical protein